MVENQKGLTIFNPVREIPHLIFNGYSSWEILEMGEGSSERDGWQCDLRPITKAHLTLSSTAELYPRHQGGHHRFSMSRRGVGWEQSFRKSTPAFRDLKFLILVLGMIKAWKAIGLLCVTNTICLIIAASPWRSSHCFQTCGIHAHGNTPELDIYPLGTHYCFICKSYHFFSSA